MENIVTQLLQLLLFSAFIHAIIEVWKYISVINLWKMLKQVVSAATANGNMSPETMRTLNFALALLYCRVFEYGVMSDMIKIPISDDNTFAWWLDYVGTASVVFVGVDVFYAKIKKMRESFNGTTLPQPPPNPPPNEG